MHINLTEKIILLLFFSLSVLVSCGGNFQDILADNLSGFEGVDLKQNAITIVPQNSNQFTLSTGLSGDYQYQWYACDGQMQNKTPVAQTQNLTLEWVWGNEIRYYCCSITNPATGKTKPSAIFPVSRTGLPTMYINVENGESVSSDKSVRKKGTGNLFGAPDSKILSDFKFDIKEVYVHGNTTARFNKIPLNLKLEKKKSFLSYQSQEASSKKWVLFSNPEDKSLLRNYIASELGIILSSGDSDWTIRTEMLDLILNGEYVGQYLLSEKIRLEKDCRISVPDIEENFDSGKEEKYGFIVEIDPHEDTEYMFDGSYSKLTYLTCDPDLKETEAEKSGSVFSYIKAKVENLEKVIATDIDSVSSVLDLKSASRWYIVAELMKDYDAGRHSTYLWYEPQSKVFHFGPVWDSDRTCGNCPEADHSEPTGFEVRNNWYFENLFKSQEFRNEVRKMWTENKDSMLLFIRDGVDQAYERNKLSAELNFRIYDTLGIPFETDFSGMTERITYDDEITAIKSWLEQRFFWLDEQFEEVLQ